MVKDKNNLVDEAGKQYQAVQEEEKSKVHIIVANAPYCINAHEEFKMVSTVIKSATGE